MAIDGNLQTGWAIAPQMGKPHQAIFEVKERVAVNDGEQLTVIE